MKKQHETLKKFGLKLKLERLKRGLSQEKLAEEADLNASYISQIERAKQNITLSNIKSIADVLGVSLSEILNLDGI